MLADDAAKAADRARRVTTFTTALQNAGILAEGGTLPPARLGQRPRLRQLNSAAARFVRAADHQRSIPNSRWNHGAEPAPAPCRRGICACSANLCSPL
jgi:hypothetical protein